ncbi:MFS transporter [Vulcanisaeta distributa]|uniref:Major facilitator superfamily MFS_1 n=1 Tax=Vulcanisaeta distributa (strain DSM 14429 / JCM 11212 / NBRC 100878 / IC-017) TaxID=572478 RepID=E1QV74_VULDI|nr:MFS transporter [Vulcanisaeta distributa]ADN50001.1 major facilitator superfamily MFS_1 [Vulcanisaeta distributa DSM 14429]
MSYEAGTQVSRWRNVVGSMLGWGLDAYDFVAYAFVAPVIAQVFFSQLGRLGSMLATLAAFSVSLAVRPLGGVFFGNLADKVGRRYVLYMTMLGAGLSSFLMGFLPTYAQAGLVAIALLIILRFAVGFFLGGEYSSSGVMAVESVTKWRGLASGIMQAGFDIGIFGVTFTYTLVATYLPENAMYTIGWRIVFWSGIVTTIIGWLFRRRFLTEAPEWEVAEKVRSPYRTLFTKYWLPVITILLATMGFLYEYYVMLELSPFVLQNVLNYSSALAGLILTVLSASDAIGSIFGGVLVDWFRSSARALLATALIIIALIYPTMYAILILSNGWLVLLWDFIAVLPVGVLQVYIRDLLPPSVRATGAGLSYNGGTWLAAWAAIITTLMAGASTRPEPWLTAITINMIWSSILIVISSMIAIALIKRARRE